MPEPPTSIRRATSSDSPGVLAIYRPIVISTAISFESQPPDEAAVAARIRTANESHVWLVAEDSAGITGYAYATNHRARHAYRYSVETSVYVHQARHGRGIGSALYRRLFEELTELGYFQAFAGITMPNEASTSLHARTGFRHVGTFPRVGFKFGQWHDVAWWHRPVQPGKPTDPQGEQKP